MMLVELLVTRTKAMSEVAVYLLETEAEKWRLFQAHYESFSIMVENGIFSVRNGSVALHFDHQGTLQTIQRADVMYSRKHVYPQHK